jgi:hypothetical protein
MTWVNARRTDVDASFFCDKMKRANQNAGCGDDGHDADIPRTPPPRPRGLGSDSCEADRPCRQVARSSIAELSIGKDACIKFSVSSRLWCLSVIRSILLPCQQGNVASNPI